MDHLRRVKGALAVATATAVCHVVMSYGYGKARASEQRNPDAVLGGAAEHLLTTFTCWALMPLLLGVGMRLMGERGNRLLVITGGLIWLPLSGYFVDEMDVEGGHLPVAVLVPYVALGALLAGNRPRDGGR
ncbi:hypothetical protein [Streptomyces sp. NPDC057702]|uniref:hypothetical protein n=1 Tax=unclassified Streptomyces TaxID=2593676 RepID=UPI00369576FB